MKSQKGKNIGVVIGLIVFAALSVYVISNLAKSNESQNEDSVSTMSSAHPLNATYKIEGSEITLVDGSSEVAIPDSTTEIVTTVWGEPINANTSGNVHDFWAVILNQTQGGSGSFFYIASCVGGGQSCNGTNAILLGDRIAPQTVEIESDGTIIVNYADRPEEAPMTEQPSVGVTRRFTVIGGVLKEVFGDF